MRVTIVILNWNGLDDTLSCLGSLEELVYPDYDVIVCDNGSTDGSVEAIRESFPQVTVVENGDNLGFAEGNNRGIRVALDRGADFVMLLNNDTTVAPDMLCQLVDGASRHPDSEIFGPKIYFAHRPSVIWFGGAMWNRSSVGFDIVGADQEDGPEFCDERETEYVCGCALFASARVWKAIGLLDPRFFVMWEETDWCARARENGFKCRMIPSSHVYHKVSQSFNGGVAGPLWSYYFWRNRLLWIEQHIGLRVFVRAEFFLLIAKAISRIVFSISWKRSSRAIASRACVRGLYDYLCRRFGKMPG